MMAFFQCCGAPPPLQVQTKISTSLCHRAGSPWRVILNSSTETPSGSIDFLFANGRMASVSCSLASLPGSLSSGACRSRPDRLPEHVFRVCGRRFRTSSPRQPLEPSKECYQPSSRLFRGFCCGALRVGASWPPLSVAMLRSSQPPQQDPRT